LKLIARSVSWAIIFVLSAAHAADEAGPSVPVEGVPLIYVWLFIVVFVGGIVGFFAYMWWLDRHKRDK
jgi:hypothetical protein